MYLSTLFLSAMSACEECRDNEVPFDDSKAAVYALYLCNYDFCTRWDNNRRVIAECVDDTYYELVCLYDVASEYNEKIPFPLRFFVQMALLNTGRKEKTTDWQLAREHSDEPPLLTVIPNII